MNRHQRRAAGKSSGATGAADPKIVEAINAGFAHYAAGRLAEADAMFAEALRRDPRHFDALRLAGVVALRSGRLAEAEQRLVQAIAVSRANAPAPPPAAQAEVVFNLGLVLQSAGKPEEAMARFAEAARLKPDFVDAHHNLANAHLRAGRFEVAAGIYRQALRHKPDRADIWFALGVALASLGQTEEAIDAYRQALDRKPDFADAHTNLAHALRGEGHIDEALAGFRQAARLRPDFPPAHANLGNVLKDAGALDAAADRFGRGLALAPDFVGLLTNLANTRKEQGQRDTAFRIYARALALDPDSADARWNDALARLAAGDLDAGWRGYEARWDARLNAPDGLPAHGRPFGQPRWTGAEPIAGKRLLVWREQGIGDEIMFASCLPDLIATGADITLECSEKLRPLLGRSFPKIRCAPEAMDTDSARDDLDLHVPIGALPRVFRRHLGDFPPTGGYLRPDPDRVVYWRNWLASLGPGPYVGVCWRGRIGKAGRSHHYSSIEEWAPILKRPGPTFINMQYDESADEVAAAWTRFGARLHTPAGIDMWNDLDEVAALLTALDRVVSAGTAVMSLAGALGVPTWLLWVEHVEDWPSLGTSGLPWYPSVRLFARTLDQPWSGVAERIAGELAGVGAGTLPV